MAYNDLALAWLLRCPRFNAQQLGAVVSVNGKLHSDCSSPPNCCYSYILMRAWHYPGKQMLNWPCLVYLVDVMSMLKYAGVHTIIYGIWPVHLHVLVHPKED